jgi:hypothetical protein
MLKHIWHKFLGKSSDHCQGRFVAIIALHHGKLVYCWMVEEHDQLFHYQLLVVNIRLWVYG